MVVYERQNESVGPDDALESRLNGVEQGQQHKHPSDSVDGFLANLAPNVAGTELPGKFGTPHTSISHKQVCTTW